jgi:ABC-type transport system involved in multi-copper enzyme maturation permease subunit
MRPILAIAAITIRTAIRSKIVLCLLAILLALIIGLPLTVKSDGTIEGQVQIIIGYTLGIAGALLSLSTLWAGCAAVAAEIQEKQIQMLVSKPVTRGEVWLGKWTGLMVLNGMMLAVCVVATYGLLRWTTQPSRLSESDRLKLTRDVMVARREVRPPPPDVEQQSRTQLADMLKRGALPAGSDPDDALELIRRNYRGMAGAVAPGNGRSWLINLPEQISPDADITVRFKFAISSVERNPIAGIWLGGTPEERDVVRVPQTNAPMAFHEVKIPARALRGGTQFVLSYANVDSSGVTVIFMEDDAITLMLPVGGFVPNLARGALIVLAQLAFLAALGVTAGTMFSLPVAGFVSIFMMLLLFSAGFIGELSTSKHIIGDSRDTAAWEAVANSVLHVVYKALNMATQPLDFDSPWEDVATARLVSWERVAKSLLVNGLLYGGALALFGTYVFNRREVALPQG